jgi:hypothetical protein
MIKAVFGTLLLCAIVLGGCVNTESRADAGIQSVATHESEREADSKGSLEGSLPDISVRTPVVLSKNKVDANGKSLYVNIEMVSGEYYYDYSPGMFEGSNWVGNFQVRIYEDEFDSESTMYCAPISIYGNGNDMRFNGVFSLAFDDYNGDGNPEFTLGQHGSINGSDYAIFSIDKKGEVSRLDTDGEMFIGEHDYSIKLEKVSSTSFSTKFYDNSNSSYVERVYKWIGNRFASKSATAD